MNKNKFEYGDLVIADTSMYGKVPAIILDSYAKKYQHGSDDQWTILMKGRSEASWFREADCELIEKGRVDLIDKWLIEIEEIKAERSDLDWIFSHGEEVMKNGYGSSVIALAAKLGMTEDQMWGSQGEGMAFAENGRRVLIIAKPYLEQKDKEGFLKLCENSYLSPIDVRYG